MKIAPRHSVNKLQMPTLAAGVWRVWGQVDMGGLVKKCIVFADSVM